MKYIFVIFSMIVISLPTIAFSQWILVNGQFEGISHFAANDSFLFAVNYESGIYRSSSNGIKWDSLPFGFSQNGDTGIVSLITNGLYLYAGLNIHGGTSDYGVFCSTDNGENWNSICGDMPKYDLLTYDLITLYAFDSLLFVNTANGLFRTINNGIHWSLSHNGLPNNAYICSMANIDTNI